MYTDVIQEAPSSGTAAIMPTVKVRLLELMHEKTANDKRFDRPVTQQEIADEIGVTRQTISDWASGKVARLDREIMYKLCKYFDCGLDELLQLED